jgi:plastin-1
MPISPEKFFDEMEDGIILCKLINAAVPGRVPPIAPEAINIHPTNMYHKLENLNLAIQSSKSIGCTVINIRPEFIMEKRGHIILGLIWQIIKVMQYSM